MKKELCEYKLSELLDLFDTFADSKELEELNLAHQIRKELLTRKSFQLLFATEELKRVVDKLAERTDINTFW